MLVLKFYLVSASNLKFFQDVFYSRKNFKRPELQKNPHRCFEKEVSFLDSFFANGMLIFIQLTLYSLTYPDKDKSVN